MKTYILYTRNKDLARKEINATGGKVCQEFTEDLLIAQLPDGFDPDILMAASTEVPARLDPVSRLAFDAWASLDEKARRKTIAPDYRERLSWDTEGFGTPQSLIPLVIPDAQKPQVSQSPTTPTSRYMIGSISIGLVIVSGENDLAFTRDEVQKVISEAQEGLQFLATAEPRAKIVFHYDIRIANVNIGRGSAANYESAEAPWRNAALGSMGFSPNRQGSIDYVNRLRQDKGTDWAYVAYFTKYPLHHFAYATDERVVMNYYNDGWGTDFISNVFAHETCHIFGAADEYGKCNCNSIHGYLSVSNRNCRICAPQFVPCLMERNDLMLCEWSRRQIGWDESLFP